MNDSLIQPVSQVINLLVAHKYGDLEKHTNGTRLSADQIAKAVADYGRTLTQPPENAFSLMDVVEVRDAKPRRWSVAMPLWTTEEGRSDLTAEMTLIEHGSGFRIQLDDIHVL